MEPSSFWLLVIHVVFCETQFDLLSIQVSVVFWCADMEAFVKAMQEAMKRKEEGKADDDEMEH